MHMPSLWVGLISWNNRHDVLRCLKALQHASYPHVTCMVVDNGSTDGTPDAVRQAFPHVRCCVLDNNYGFARAANVVLRQAQQHQSDYVLLLNADTDFAPPFLEHLVTAAEQHPESALFSPKIYLRDDPRRLWAIGGVLTRGRIRFYGLNALDTGQFDRRELDFVMGCAILIRTEILQHIGLFDDRFFVFYEEIDLCVRARSAGWRVTLLPEVHLWHAGGATTRKSPHIREFYLARSRLLFLRKHRAVFNVWALALYEVALTTQIVAIHITQRAFRAGAAYLHGATVGLLRRGRVTREPYGTG
jgi:hypothetical protein